MIFPKSLKHYLFGILLLGATVSYSADFIERGQLSPPDRPFRQPQAIAVGGDGTIYVIDTGNNRLVAFDQRGRHIKSIGGFGFEADQFDQPLDIWAGSLINLYIADYNNDRVQRYDRGLNFLSTLDGSNVEDPYSFSQVVSCAVNSNNELFVLERGENKIIKFNRFGKPERRFGDYESGEGELVEAQQIDILQNKFLAVSDAANSSILLFDFFGTYLRTLQMPDLKKPTGICVLPDGRMLVCDPDGGHIWVWQQNLAEAQTVHFPPQLSIKHPRDAAVHAADNELRLYIIDSDRVVFGYLR